MGAIMTAGEFQDGALVPARCALASGFAEGFSEARKARQGDHNLDASAQAGAAGPPAGVVLDPSRRAAACFRFKSTLFSIPEAGR